MDEFLEQIKLAMELSIKERQIQIDRKNLEDQKEMVAVKILKKYKNSQEKKFHINGNTVTLLYSMSMDGHHCFRLDIFDKDQKRIGFSWFY